MTLPDAPLANPSTYPALSPDELETELANIVGQISGAYRELSAVKAQRLMVYHQGYRNSHENSHAGRDAHGQQAAFAVEEDQIALELNIESLLVLRDFLGTLLERRGSR
jgi:hypothetical protein